MRKPHRNVGEPGFKVAYDESVRILTQQASALDNLRMRASTILAAATLVTTFLGAQAFAKPTLTKPDSGTVPVLLAHHLNRYGWAAIGALVAVFLLTLLVVFPLKDWRYGQSADELTNDLLAQPNPMDLESVQGAVAINLEANFKQNERLLNRLNLYFKLACLGTVLEAILWIVDLETIS